MKSHHCQHMGVFPLKHTAGTLETAVFFFNYILYKSEMFKNVFFFHFNKVQSQNISFDNYIDIVFP